MRKFVARTASGARVQGRIWKIHHTASAEFPAHGHCCSDEARAPRHVVFTSANVFERPLLRRGGSRGGRNDPPGPTAAWPACAVEPRALISYSLMNQRPALRAGRGPSGSCASQSAPKHPEFPRWRGVPPRTPPPQPVHPCRIQQLGCVVLCFSVWCYVMLNCVVCVCACV